MFKNIATIILCSFLLIGCAGKGVQEHYTNRDVINHPSWPSPITERKFNVKVVVAEGHLFVGMNFEDNIEYQIYQEDVLRYLKDIKAMVCFYRANLKEKECEKDPN